ncbi:MAG: UDP-N-acetylmuramoyl-L-alanyl-D-glutamate--2,6-diaminopimelate ligase [Nitrospinota bacterium]
MTGYIWLKTDGIEKQYNTMKIKEIFDGIELIHLKGSLDKEISSICYDSRNVKNGSLFVAIKGLRFNGHDFLHEVIKKGAKAVVVENEILNTRGVNSNGTDITYIGVYDSRKTLACISAIFYRHPSREMSVIGITGTNGKTTTSYLINSILGMNGYRTGIIGTIDYRFNGEVIPSSHTTPESLDLQGLLRKMADKGVRYCVMEVSSHSLELERVYGMRFETGIFTNLTQDHLDFHGSLEKYFEAKSRLFRDYGLKKAVINIDDQYGRRLIRDTGAESVLTYSIGGEADVAARDISVSFNGLHFFIDTPLGGLPIESRLIGRHNIYNILASVSAAILEGLSKESILKGILSVDTIPGRLERIEEGQDFMVLVDYAHTDDAMKNILTTARELPHNKLIVVFGCGGDRDRGKRPLMGKVGVMNSDLAIVTSDNPRGEDPLKIIEEIEHGIKGSGFDDKGMRYVKIPDRRKAIEFSVSRASRGDIVVIAGKGHENYQIFGDKRIHFDDREVVREAIKKRVRG